MYRKLNCLLVLLAAVLMSIGSANASIRQHKPADSLRVASQPKSHMLFGVRTGMMFRNGVTIQRSDGPEWHADFNAGLSIGAFLELPSPQWTTAAIDFNLHRVVPNSMPPAFDQSRWMPDIGVVIKPAIRKDHYVFSVRPVLGIAYGRLSGISNVVSATNFMVIKLGGEGLYFFSKRTGLLVEALFVAAPYGRASAKGPGSVIDEQPVRYNLASKLRPMIRFGLAYR